METTINGLNGTAISAVMEILLVGPKHFQYAQASRMAQEFVEAERQALQAKLRADMQAHMPTDPSKYSLYNVD